MAAEFDLVIRGGTVVDGTGRMPIDADVGIKGSRIAAIGAVAETGAEEIDAKGKLVTPGFVDIHTHYDGQAVWDSRMTPSSMHGVTTAVMGNCGVGFAPCKPADREKLVELMEGVEDIPGPVMHEGLKWEWESFSEYLDALDRRNRDIDLCALLPHAAVRVFVMGERAIALENANQADIAQMREIAADAMRAGAFGFSTSRSLSHKSLKGNPTPTLRAQEDELTGIAMGMRDAGSGFLEIVSEWAPDPKAEFDMLRRVIEKCGRPCVFTLTQRHARPTVWRDLLGYADEAIAAGVSMRPVVAHAPSACCWDWRAARIRSPARHPTNRSRTCLWPNVCAGCATRRSARRCCRRIRRRTAPSRCSTGCSSPRCSASATRQIISRGVRIRLPRSPNARVARRRKLPTTFCWRMTAMPSSIRRSATTRTTTCQSARPRWRTATRSWASATAERMSRSFLMPVTRPGC